jgi:hypothetical protein
MSHPARATIVRTEWKEQAVADIEDAKLIVELAKWGTMSGAMDAARVVLTDDFDPDTADASDEPVHAILAFFETVGTLVKQGLLDRALVYDWIWAAGMWDRVGPAAKRQREQLALPALYENFEALAEGQRAAVAAG